MTEQEARELAEKEVDDKVGKFLGLRFGSLDFEYKMPNGLIGCVCVFPEEKIAAIAPM